MPSVTYLPAESYAATCIPSALPFPPATTLIRKGFNAAAVVGVTVNMTAGPRVGSGSDNFGVAVGMGTEVDVIGMERVGVESTTIGSAFAVWQLSIPMAAHTLIRPPLMDPPNRARPAITIKLISAIRIAYSTSPCARTCDDLNLFMTFILFMACLSYGSGH